MSYAASGLSLANNSIVLQSNFNGSGNQSAISLGSDGNINISPAISSSYVNIGASTVRFTQGGPVVTITPTTITAGTISASAVGNSSTALTGLTLALSNTAVFGGNIITTQATKTGTSAGTAGQVSVDANYIYVCTSTNVWKRAALSAF